MPSLLHTFVPEPYRRSPVVTVFAPVPPEVAPSADASVSAPAESKLEVAVDPNAAEVKAEKRVVEALPNVASPVKFEVEEKVEEACETRPFVSVTSPVSVEAPVTPSVDEKVPAPPEKVPTVAEFA
jgi:hypothetical protein